MHGKGIVHADLQPANLLMRPEDFAAAEWSQWLGMPRICESDLHAPLFGGCISPRGCIFKVVVGDLGSAGLACPEERVYKKPAPGATPEGKVVRLCAPEYRPPDLFLGNERYSQAVDMWPLGCLGADLLFRVSRFHPTGNISSRMRFSRYGNPHDFLNSHASLLGCPSGDALQFLESLPSKLSDFGLVLEEIEEDHVVHAFSFPTHLRHFVEQTLTWNPCARLTAASASQHAFLTRPCLST